MEETVVLVQREACRWWRRVTRKCNSHVIQWNFNNNSITLVNSAVVLLEPCPALLLVTEDGCRIGASGGGGGSGGNSKPTVNGQRQPWIEYQCRVKRLQLFSNRNTRKTLVVWAAMVVVADWGAVGRVEMAFFRNGDY